MSSEFSIMHRAFTLALLLDGAERKVKCSTEVEHVTEALAQLVEATKVLAEINDVCDALSEADLRYLEHLVMLLTDQQSKALARMHVLTARANDPRNAPS